MIGTPESSISLIEGERPEPGTWVVPGGRWPGTSISEIRYNDAKNEKDWEKVGRSSSRSHDFFFFSRISSLAQLSVPQEYGK